jgi:hypothetical protein
MPSSPRSDGNQKKLNANEILYSLTVLFYTRVVFFFDFYYYYLSQRICLYHWFPAKGDNCHER